MNLYFTQPLTLKDSTIVNDNGTTNGSIRIVVQGGTAPYAYNWSSVIKSSHIVNLRAGAYSVTVTDARSCIQTFSFTIKSTVATDDPKASLVSYSMDDAAIKFSSEEKVESVEVFTLNGQSIWSQSVRGQQFSIRRNQLSKGLILVQLHHGSGKVTSLK
ncbi:MAG: SprB repeat-containing protein [Saprospiraceae bacterium]|nr:SprB repeat-containing protein [Candidatus Vicinibacter affinis]